MKIYDMTLHYNTESQQIVELKDSDCGGALLTIIDLENSDLEKETRLYLSEDDIDILVDMLVTFKKYLKD